MADYDSAQDGLIFNEALIRARVESLSWLSVRLQIGLTLKSTRPGLRQKRSKPAKHGLREG